MGKVQCLETLIASIGITTNCQQMYISVSHPGNLKVKILIILISLCVCVFASLFISVILYYISSKETILNFDNVALLFYNFYIIVFN